MKFASYAKWTTPQGTTERDLLRCCHCQVQWYVKPGSGNTRGWCGLCAQPTCGSLNCQNCIPFMKKIEAQEKRQKLFKELGI